jgi:hypothetical protein
MQRQQVPGNGRARCSPLTFDQPDTLGLIGRRKRASGLALRAVERNIGMGGIIGAVVGDVVGLVTGGGGSDPNAMLAQEEAQFQQNFELQTQAAMNDNMAATRTAITNSHAQTWAGASASARETDQANAHIDA